MSRYAPAERRSLPLVKWPEQDRVAWATATATGDYFDEAGVLTGRRSSTLESYRWAYGRWLGFIARTAADLLLAKPAGRVTREALSAFVELLRKQVASATVAQTILGLEQVIRALAPERDWRWLRRVVSRLMKAVVPVRSKQARILPVNELLQAGHDLMAAAEQGIGRSPQQRAAGYRDGLILAFLALRPFRLQNFAGIRIGQHLLQCAGSWQLVFAGEETKNHSPIETPFPTQLEGALDTYLQRWRPILLRERQSDFLWLHRGGTQILPKTMTALVARVTQQRLGVRLTPHLFRDCLATDVAIREPGEIRIASALLGHRLLRTTERHYNHARQLEASQSLQQGVLDLRRAAERRQEG